MSTTDTEPTPPGGDSDHRGGGAPDPRSAAGSKTLKRLRDYSVMNMVVSLLAVFALAFAWWALQPSPEGPERREVLVAPVSRYAAEQADFPVWTPEAVLGEGWTANFADYDTFAGEVSWRIGLVSPKQEYVELSQTADPTREWLSALIGKAGEAAGTRMITGPDGPQEWAAYEGEERALVLEPGEGRGATTVVRGSAGWTELEQFIGLLEPASGG